MIDVATFLSNRARIPLGELERYANQYVVWSETGEAILMADPNPNRLAERMAAAGLSGAKVLVSFNVYPDEGEYGAALTIGEEVE